MSLGGAIYTALNVVEWNKNYLTAKGDINIKNSGKLSSENISNFDLILANMSVRSNDGLKKSPAISIL
ncbi:MAG: hypothetical protein J6568_07050 [Snodgrassella sp.]|nr:hypothetical protein [Snodgrassella sp.]